MRYLRWLALFLTLSTSACLSKPTIVELLRLDDKNYQVRRVSEVDLKRLTEPKLFVGDEELRVRNVSYNRHLLSFDPAGPKAQFEDHHTFELETELSPGTEVEIRASDGETLTGKVEVPSAHPGIHVDRIGYQPGAPMVVKLGLSLGERELPLPENSRAEVLSTDSNKPLMELKWRRTPESGYPFQPNPNQQVATVVLPELPAGEYRLRVAGWGLSEAVHVRPDAALESARNYALGLYHQRCGVELKAPYTRWPRPACHTAEVVGAGKPIVGGHHDAGDYGRYTHNSAQTAHALLFAGDHWFEQNKPDSLGLPESEDGVSDLHQVALIELDFLLQMQRPDGLFWGRLSPKDRAYESDVPADKAGPQRVREGSSAASAAAVAALFQGARSAYLKATWPEKAESYAAAAEKGWQALDGLAFQKADHHYGDVFEDADERAWAATERALFHHNEPPLPADPELRRWGWWPAFEGYGGAARAAAFSTSPGPSSVLFVTELTAASKTWLDAHKASAYGVTFPLASKAHQSAGWFFPHDYSFDLITAHLLEPNSEAVQAVWANWSYGRGLNPLSQVFLTGYGSLSPRFILHLQAMNDNFELPPSGIPVGSIVTNIRFANVPQNVDIPPFQPGAEGKSLDQRFSDSPNVLSEATVVNQARGLAVCSWLAFRKVESPDPPSPVGPERR